MKTSGAALACLGLAILSLAGCGRALGPSETVEAYLHARSADPARTLLLTTHAFQLRHEIPFTAPGQEPGRRESTTALADRPAPSPPGRSERLAAVARAQFAWLLALRSPGFGPAAAAQRARLQSEERRGDRATVTARILSRATPAFEVRFALSRDDGSWRIDAVEPVDIPRASRFAACAVAPSRTAGCFREAH